MSTAVLRWEPSYRIIPSRFPPVQLFETVADPRDLDAVFALEALTNPRLRQETGALELVPMADRIAGPGSTAIMAAFTHVNPAGGRFSDATFGVYYCARELETAIAETVHHLVRRLGETREPPQDLDMRVVQAELRATLVTLDAADHAPLLHPDHYAESQAFARRMRAEGAEGIHYPSVRHASGRCAAVFRPRLLSPCIQTRHLGYPWDGRTIPRDRIYVKTTLPLDGQV